jgi:hypothetical protein
VNAPEPIIHQKISSSLMFTLIVATVGLAFFYGTLWHNQPARSPDREKQDAQQITRPPELIATPPAVNAWHNLSPRRRHRPLDKRSSSPRRPKLALCGLGRTARPSSPRAHPRSQPASFHYGMSQFKKWLWWMETHHHETTKRQSDGGNNLLPRSRPMEETPQAPLKPSSAIHNCTAALR